LQEMQRRTSGAINEKRRESLPGQIINIINAGITEPTVGSTLFSSGPTNYGTLSHQDELTKPIFKTKKINRETKNRARKIQVVPVAKLEVLQKVFDKVYKQKKDVGTQLDYLNDSFSKEI